MSGERREIDDSTLLGAFAKIPFMTLKVMAAIHWEALRIWLKGVKFRPSPPPPATAVTHIARGASARPDLKGLTSGNVALTPR